MKEIIAFIGEEARADTDSGFIFGVDKFLNFQPIAEVRGWGAIQKLFTNKKGTLVDIKSAEEFQDNLKKFIASAITEKIQKEQNQ